MDTRPLWVPQPQALSVLYANLENFALQQEEAFVGTAGSVVERENASGTRFYAHQFYDADRKQRERYLAGPVGDATADARAGALRARIGEMKALVPSMRMLGREGFHVVDPRAYGVIASLHNSDVFAAGGVLVGSHAYGVVLNRMGIRAAPYVTEDVDIARPARLAFARPPEKSFVEMLADSGIAFLGIPGFDRKKPPTSFKQRGKGSFHVDLLVPSRDETFRVVAVPELRAHATSLPYLGYLLAESQIGMAMARESCCKVRVPLPERFAVHKLVVSRLRTGRNTKARKDVEQACVLLAALDDHGGAIEAAVAALPRRAKKHLRAALDQVRAVIEESAPRAWRELVGSF